MAGAPFGNTTLFPTLTLEAGFATALSGFGVWDATLWDAALWGPDTVWTDITDKVYTIQTNRGRSRETDRYTAGTMTVTFNNQDDRFSPVNLVGPYAVGGITQIRPGVPIRLTATWNSVTYPVFFGYADEWADEYLNYGFTGNTTLTVVDALSTLAAFEGVEVTPVGASEKAGARIARIAANAGFAGALNLDVGYNTMQATTLAANALDEAGATADSDAGLLWADAQGALVFFDQFAALTKTRSNTSQFTFGPGGSEVGYTDLQVAYDSTLIFNTLSFARAGGDTIISLVDTDSQALYGKRTYQRSDFICETDAQVIDMQNFFMERFAVPELRMVGLRVNPPGTPADASFQWPLVLGALFRDRVTGKVTAPGGTAITQQLFIDGISHSITKDAGWSVQFGFGSATAYAPFTSFGYWDSAVWDSSVWLP